ncbi:MAG: hypothetical protein KGL39_36695 [Patescibacteria group bacterium]|nr:hypothetical protein [Patescibacteria group bacterium]
MAIATYSDLKTATANWLHRNDLTANIPDFIMMAEWRLSRDLRVSPLINTSTITISAGASTGTMPTDNLGLVNLQIQNGAELAYVPPDTIDRVTGSGTTVPWVYTLIGTTVKLAPLWTAGGTLSITYFRKEAVLSDTNATNWYITNAPDTLLYATLLEAAPYLLNDNRIDVWEKYYKRGVDAINAQYGNVDPHKRMLMINSPDTNQNRATVGA